MRVKGYLAALPTAAHRHYEERIYRVYVTDALMTIAENTATHLGLDGPVEYGGKMTNRWVDIVEKREPHVEPPEDDRPCAEIVSGIWERMRGENQ